MKKNETTARPRRTQAAPEAGNLLSEALPLLERVRELVAANESEAARLRRVRSLLRTAEGVLTGRVRCEPVAHETPLGKMLLQVLRENGPEGRPMKAAAVVSRAGGGRGNGWSKMLLARLVASGRVVKVGRRYLIAPK